MRGVRVQKITIGSANPLVLIAGPCVIESEKQCVQTARRLKALATRAKIPFIFKASFDKANRLSLGSFRGPGVKKGIEILKRVKEDIGVPVLSDIHCRQEIECARSVLDIIQIPALLCRQTDLVIAASKTGKVINVKKGQFLAPWDMLSIIRKIESTGNRNILITERGFCFGYNNLVSDFRSLAILRDFGYPVIYDATHSVQLPGGKGVSSGGQREFVAGLSRAAVAFGCDGLFLEVHPYPERALCDGPNMISIGALEKLIRQIKRIGNALKGIQQ